MPGNDRRTRISLSGPWVTFEVNYEERTSYYCRITATFTPNDKTVAYYATCVYGSYFDDDPDDPDFEPNTEEDMIGYLSAQKPISNNTLTESSWGYSTEYILAVVGVDADGNFGKLNWAKLKTPARSSSGDQGQSEAALRIQHVVVNSSELEGAPENCFATVYRFEPTAGARAFRYEDGYYKGDFAKKGDFLLAPVFLVARKRLRRRLRRLLLRLEKQHGSGSERRRVLLLRRHVLGRFDGKRNLRSDLHGLRCRRGSRRPGLLHGDPARGDTRRNAPADTFGI